MSYRKGLELARRRRRRRFIVGQARDKVKGPYPAPRFKWWLVLGSLVGFVFAFHQIGKQ